MVGALERDKFDQITGPFSELNRTFEGSQAIIFAVKDQGGAGQAFVYELLYAGQGGDGRAFVTGLLEVAALQHGYDAARSGSEALQSGSGRPAAGGQSGTGRGTESPADADTARLAEDLSASTPKPLIRKNNGQHAPYAYAAS